MPDKTGPRSVDYLGEKQELNHMEVKTYRARSLQEALQLVRRDLGPEAAVLHTREVRGGFFRWLKGRRVEVTASTQVNVPSRLPPERPAAVVPEEPDVSPQGDDFPQYDDFRSRYRRDLQDESSNLPSLVEQLCQPSRQQQQELPPALFRLFTDLLDAEIHDDLAREFIEQVRRSVSPRDLDDPALLRARLVRLLEDEIPCCGPIRVTPGQRRLVALVGPTGVGKTTTIAKLAASFHLRQRQRVGLVTVDTYRIAAVDQLRTYADIIDLPMEVVATPREMRAALARMADLDLILMDTAGRSPRDEVKIQELKTMLAEAQADEVHLVLSSVASAVSLKRVAERFAEVGVTALLLTKLDEAAGLGNLVAVLRGCRLPLSYVTHGQNVPDDIAAADGRKLAYGILGTDLTDERGHRG